MPGSSVRSRGNLLTVAPLPPVLPASGVRHQPQIPYSTGILKARPRGFEPLNFGSVDRGLGDSFGSSKPNRVPKGAKNAPENRNCGQRGASGREVKRPRPPPLKLPRLRDVHACSRAASGHEVDGDAYELHVVRGEPRVDVAGDDRIRSKRAVRRSMRPTDPRVPRCMELDSDGGPAALPRMQERGGSRPRAGLRPSGADASL